MKNIHSLTQTALIAAALAAGLAPAASAQASSKCAAVPDCAETYPKYTALFSAKWDMKLYHDFLARYDEVSTDRRYAVAADAPAPKAPANEDEWYDKWAARLPYNPKPWSLDLATFKGTLDGYARGFDEAEALFKALAGMSDPKALRAALKAKQAGVFPGDMGQERFTTEDVVYVYLGQERRDFLRGKLDALKANKKVAAGQPPKRREPALAELGQWSRFLSAGDAAPAPMVPHKTVEVSSRAVAAAPSPTKDAALTAPAAPAAPTGWDKKYPASLALDAHTRSRYRVPTPQLLADWKSLKAEGGHPQLLARLRKEIEARWAVDAVTPRRVAALKRMPGMSDFLAKNDAPVVRQGRGGDETAAKTQPQKAPEKQDPEKRAPSRQANKKHTIIVPSPLGDKKSLTAVSHPQPWKDQAVQPRRSGPSWLTASSSQPCDTELIFGSPDVCKVALRK